MAGGSEKLGVWIFNDPDRWTAYLEVQTRPDPSPIMSWQSKHAGIAIRTNRNTILLVVYLKRGGYRTLPDGYEMTEGNLTTPFHFSKMLLRNHTEAIESGEVPGLAPFLVMCYDNAGPEVLARGTPS